MTKNISIILSFLVILKLATASYSGPFLLWGTEGLDKVKLPSLEAIDEKYLSDIFVNASSIVIFIRNSTTALTRESFPKLSEVINSSEWLYLTQEKLSSDPVEFNVNAEVLTLTGSFQQQDDEITATYRYVQEKFGKNQVLGILATRNKNSIYKRDVETEAKTKIESEVVEEKAEKEVNSKPKTNAGTKKPNDVIEAIAEMEAVADMILFEEILMETFILAALGINEKTENITYLVNNTAFLYAYHAPVFNISKNNTVKDSFVLNRFTTLTARNHSDLFVLSIDFEIPQKLVVHLYFDFIGFYWTLSRSKVEFNGTSEVLRVVGQPAEGRMNQSYACGGSLLFRNQNSTLVFKKYQVEPRLQFNSNFSSAIDCVGVTNPFILSATFVISLLGAILIIAITAILDIKTPDKFEVKGSKPLTFIVQE